TRRAGPDVARRTRHPAADKPTVTSGRARCPAAGGVTPLHQPGRANFQDLLPDFSQSTVTKTHKAGMRAKKEAVSWDFAGGRYWDRTSDLFGVNEARSRCANRPRRSHTVPDARACPHPGMTVSACHPGVVTIRGPRGLRRRGPFSLRVSSR